MNGMNIEEEEARMHRSVAFSIYRKPKQVEADEGPRIEIRTNTNLHAARGKEITGAAWWPCL